MTTQFRSFESSNPTVRLAAAFARRGIADHGTALEGAARTRRVDVFVMADGTMRRADSRLVAECAREARAPRLGASDMAHTAEDVAIMRRNRSRSAHALLDDATDYQVMRRWTQARMYYGERPVDQPVIEHLDGTRSNPGPSTTYGKYEPTQEQIDSPLFDGAWDGEIAND